MANRAMWAPATVLAALALALTAAGARADTALDLDRALKQQAPQVLQYLQKRDDKNIAVLKFLADYGDGKLRDNVGALNRMMADRLEVALVLALDPAHDQQMCVLTHASDAVEKSRDRTLNHRTEEGRAAFFPTDLPPLRFKRAWVAPGEDDTAPADAFVTGEAVVAKDWKTVKIRLQAFDRKDPKDIHVIGDWFTVAVDPRMLMEMDVSFVHKKGVPDGPDDSASEQAEKVAYLTPSIPGTPPLPPVEEKKQEEAWAEFLRNSPVELKILYKGNPIPIHEGAVDTPDKDDVVTFHLRNTDPKTTYGVVLKINGESTIDRQTLPPLDCYKWILSPGEEITIDGYQGEGDTAKGFKVLAPAASRGQAVNYGDDAGVFSLVVFRAADAEGDKAFVLGDEKHNQDVKAVSRGSLVTPGGDQPPQSLKALQDALTPSTLSNAAKKGIIVPDKEHPSKVKHVDFTPFPRPEWALEVRYYQPRD
ncbi:MAG TPA: hypothetical protein VMS17_30950 [Gemmataceae bacterium]|nr:hypothetical protein [Gemmataceae bacterium]